MYDVELIAGDLWRSQATYTGALVNRYIHLRPEGGIISTAEKVILPHY